MPRIPGMNDLFAGTAYSGPGAVCGICGRALKNPASIERSIGPVCAGSAHPKTTSKEAEEMRARYTTEVETVLGIAAITIRDTGHDSTKSVTNDAERVVLDLRERGFKLNMPVIYCDSMGRWDGLTIRNGVFAGFYPLNSPGSTDYKEARVMLATMMALRDQRLGDATPRGPVSVED
ncbi:conserved protein of unknown function (plasmid) [Rhodovastum atsumiense]|nr:conserved protein of unknown function [Rhodovastum atsumiense]